MKKIREIIRLKKAEILSDRQIAKALNISRPLVTKYWERFKNSPLVLQDLDGIPDSVLLSNLEKANEGKDGKYLELSQYFVYFIKELKRKGVTRLILWNEYKERYPEGYQYTQFCHHFQMWNNASEIRLHIEHKAGDKMFVDYAGNKLFYIDPKTGEKVFVETFVAVLGASGLTYAELTLTQQKEDWIRSNEHAFEYIGGSVKALVPDNLRSAVNRSHRYEPDINPEFAEFAEYYDTVIIPARVREPRDKALVENAVKLVYQRIYAPLRNKVFHSLEELNIAVRPLLEKHNNTPFQRLPMSRRGLFEASEKSELGPLPAERYPMKTIKPVTVQYNYHVELREDFHYYSVPYYLYVIGRKTRVKMVFDERIVAVYYDNVRIAQHIRDRQPNGYTTIPEHMPPKHRKYGKWDPDRFLKWARSMGPETFACIKRVLEIRKHPEQAYKSCMGILNLGRKYGDDRLERTCKKTNHCRTCSLKVIENLIKRDIEQKKSQLELPGLPEHENIRGNSYYH